MTMTMEVALHRTDDIKQNTKKKSLAHWGTYSSKWELFSSVRRLCIMNTIRLDLSKSSWCAGANLMRFTDSLVICTPASNLMLGHWPHKMMNQCVLNQLPKNCSGLRNTIELANINHFRVTTTVSECFQKHLNTHTHTLTFSR